MRTRPLVLLFCDFLAHVGIRAASKLGRAVSPRGLGLLMASTAGVIGVMCGTKDSAGTRWCGDAVLAIFTSIPWLRVCFPCRAVAWFPPEW